MPDEDVKKNGKPGRPTKKTDQRVRILQECLEEGLHAEIAANYAKIGRTTLFEWLQKDPEFRTQYEFWKSKGIRRLAGKVEGKDPWKLLKNVARKHYQENVEITHEATVNLVVNAGDGDKEEFDL